MKSLRSKISLISIATLVWIGCNSNPYTKGERVYQKACNNCHMEDGQGLSKLIPSLHNIESLSLTRQACIIKNGYNADSLGESMRVMPALKSISPPDLTNLINYINWKWGEQKVYDLNEVKQALEGCY